MDPRDIMTYQEAADYLGSTVTALRSAASRGDITPYRPARARYKVFYRQDIENYKNGLRARSRAKERKAEQTGQAEQGEKGRFEMMQQVLTTAQNLWTEQDRAMVATIGSAFTPLALALRDALSNFFKVKESQNGTRLDDFLATVITNPRSIGEEMARGMAAHEPGAAPEQSEQYTREMGDFAERTVAGMLQMALQPSTARKREEVPV